MSTRLLAKAITDGKDNIITYEFPTMLIVSGLLGLIFGIEPACPEPPQTENDSGVRSVLSFVGIISILFCIVSVGAGILIATGHL